MRLTYIHIQNFKSIRDMEIRDIDRALILVGKNNTGKTSVLDAVCAALGCYEVQEQDFNEQGQAGAFRGGSGAFSQAGPGEQIPQAGRLAEELL